MDGIIGIDGPAFSLTGEPQRVLAGDTMTMLRRIAADIKSLGWDGTISIHLVNGRRTVDALVALGGSSKSHEYPSPKDRFIIRSGYLEVDGIGFSAQDASVPMEMEAGEETDIAPVVAAPEEREM